MATRSRALAAIAAITADRLERERQLKPPPEVPPPAPPAPRAPPSPDTPLTEAQLADMAVPFEVTCGVYFLLRGRRVVYVGQSINILARIATHAASEDKRGRWDAWAYVPCEARRLDAVEGEYIRRFRPPLNKVGKLSANDNRRVRAC